MPTKKPSVKQLAARAKFVKMVRAKAAKSKAAKKKTVGKIVKKKTIKQTGTSNKFYDKKIEAKKPGKRKTSNPHKYRGKTIKKSTTYTEKRANRSDKGRLLGIGNVSRLTKAQELKRLIQLANISKSPLTKKVALIIKNKAYGYDNLEQVFNDLRNGLQSGIVSELIYYSDTIKWYKKYNKEIIKMLKNTIDELGVQSPAQVFGQKWDSDDFLIKETNNQNLLAWFSFEETAFNLQNELGYN